MVEFRNTRCKKDEEGSLIEFGVVTAGGTSLLFMPDNIEEKVGIHGLTLKNLLDVLAVPVHGSDSREVSMLDPHHVLYRVTTGEAYLYNSKCRKVHTFQLGGQ